MELRKKVWIKMIVAIILLAAYQFLFPLPPQTNLIRFFALAGFFMLCASLIIGPLAVLFPKKFCALIKHRKRVGIVAFVFIAAHFLLVLYYTYALNTSFLFSDVRTIAALLATIIILVLAITSANRVLRKMGFPKWKMLQRGAYVAFALSFFHFLLDTNGLFISISGGRIFLNIAEVVMIILGVLTIVLQVMGFLSKRKAKTSAKVPENSCPLEPEAE